MPFPFGDDVSARFTGTVYFKNMIQKDDVYNFPVTNTITFAPGSRSAWHVHGGMEILVIGGKGYYQEKGKKAQIIRKGDVVHIPAGAIHWHGAAPDSTFAHLAANTNPEKTGVVWGSRLSAEEYKKLPAK